MEHETRFELAFPSTPLASHTRRSLIARTRSLTAGPPSSVGMLLSVRVRAKPAPSSRYKKSPPCFAGRAHFVCGARDQIRTGDPHVGKRNRTRGRSMSYASAAGEERQQEAMRSNGDGIRHRGGALEDAQSLLPEGAESPRWGVGQSSARLRRTRRVHRRYTSSYSRRKVRRHSRNRGDCRFDPGCRRS